MKAFRPIKKKLTIEWDEYINGFTSNSESTSSEFATEGDYSKIFKDDLIRLNYTIDINGAVTPLTEHDPDNDVFYAKRIKTFERLITNSKLRTDISRMAHQGAIAEVLVAFQPMLKTDHQLTDSDTLIKIKPTNEMDRSEIQVTTKYLVTNTNVGCIVPDVSVAMTRTLLSAPSDPEKQRMDAVQYAVSIKYEVPLPASPKSLSRRVLGYLGRTAMSIPNSRNTFK